jgi:hypothetical protein
MLPALGPSFYEGLPQAQAEPGVFGSQRVCRRRRPKDQPHVGQGIYRHSPQPGQSCGEFTTTRVTIENFWARRGRELSQNLT